MTHWVFHTASEEATRRAGERLAEVAQPGDVVLLDGPLGSGKTRFAQGVARGLGITRAVTSPTFGLLNVYDEGRLPLYHFDLYRLDTEEDLESIDFFATVEGEGLSLIEWANRFPDAMPEDRLTLTLQRDSLPEGEVDSATDGPGTASTELTITGEAAGPAAQALLENWKAALS